MDLVLMVNPRLNPVYFNDKSMIKNPGYLNFKKLNPGYFNVKSSTKSWVF